MTCSPDELAVLASDFADRFLAVTGVDASWRSSVLREFRVQPSGKRLFVTFRANNRWIPWDGSIDEARRIVSESFDDLVEHWRSLHADGPDFWDVPVGGHVAAGCRCESVATFAGDDATAYASSHLRWRKDSPDGTTRLYFCPFTFQRWVLTPLSGVLQRLDDLPITPELRSGS